GHTTAHRRNGLTSDRHPLSQSGLAPLLVGTPHPQQYFRWHAHSWYLVGQELGVPERDQRPDADDHRHAERLQAIESRLELPDIEYRLGHRETGARVDLPGVARQLTLEVRRTGIDADTVHESGGGAEWVAAGIEAAIEPRDQVGEAYRVDVEHRGRVRIRAHLGRVAGDHQHVAQSG